MVTPMETTLAEGAGASSDDPRGRSHAASTRSASEPRPASAAKAREATETTREVTVATVLRAGYPRHAMARDANAAEPRRCSWVSGPNADARMTQYHDEEWGVPVHDDRKLFEMLILEGAQAGLSWRTILNKREGYRRAFDGFDVKKIARYDERRVAKLLLDEGIVRNRLKVQATVGNARALPELVREHGSLDAFVWSFVGGAPIVRGARAAVPARTAESDALSKALLAHGFRFVGSTIVYAFMQACGLVDDHDRTCFRAAPLRAR
jgi:DNA-3-methyladenine glycosylase I